MAFSDWQQQRASGDTEPLPVLAHNVPDPDSSSGSGCRWRGHRRPASRPWLWVIWMLILGVVFWAVFEFFVRTDLGQRLDHTALQAVGDQGFGQSFWSQLPDFIQAFLDALPVIVAVLALVTFVVMTLARRRWAASLIAVLVFVLGNVSAQLLKNYVLVRPLLDNGVPYYTGNSLPSGHTAFAALAVTAVFLVVSPYTRPFVAFWGVIFALAVGVSTYLEGWHRPSDIVAAFLLAGIWGLLGGLIIFRIDPQWNSYGPGGRPRRSRWNSVLWTLGLLCLLLFCVVVAFMLVDAVLVGKTPVVPGIVATVLGVLFVLASGFLVFALLANIFHTETGLGSAGTRQTA